MTNILRLDSSASGAASVTTGLNDQLVSALTGVHTDATVVTRDLTQLPVLTTDRFAANGTEATQRTTEQTELAAIGDEVIAELAAADIIVLAAPVYNFGVPSSVKAWMDLVARAGVTFAYTDNGPKGLLADKRAYVVSASGGVELGSELDFATPHITLFLNFLGIEDVSLIDAGGLMANPGKVNEAEAQIQELISV